jgi:serine kinase of HPr protein (carbohydrate metabolism regulator)
VRWHDRGVLIEGASGAGKSDLALRLVDAGAELVADDVVALERAGHRLVARGVGMPGHLEVRGQGIYRVAAADSADLAVAVVLGGRHGERLPKPAFRELLGVELPVIPIDATAASAVMRLRIALLGTRIA